MIRTLAVGATLGLALFTTALAQGPPWGPPGGHPEGHPGGPPDGPPPSGADAVKHLADMYAMIAPFDVNVDDQLDTTETAALATAITKGTVKGLPHPMSPKGDKPKPEMIAKHLAELYSTISTSISAVLTCPSAVRRSSSLLSPASKDAWLGSTWHTKVQVPCSIP